MKNILTLLTLICCSSAAFSQTFYFREKDAKAKGILEEELLYIDYKVVQKKSERHDYELRLVTGPVKPGQPLQGYLVITAAGSGKEKARSGIRKATANAGNNNNATVGLIQEIMYKDLGEMLDKLPH